MCKIVLNLQKSEAQTALNCTVCMFGSVLSPKKVDFRQLPIVFVSDLIHLPWQKQVTPTNNEFDNSYPCPMSNVHVQLVNLVHDHCSGFSLLLILSWLPTSLPTISLAPEGYSCCPIVTVEVGTTA